MSSLTNDERSVRFSAATTGGTGGGGRRAGRRRQQGAAALSGSDMSLGDGGSGLGFASSVRQASLSVRSGLSAATSSVAQTAAEAWSGVSDKTSSLWHRMLREALNMLQRPTFYQVFTVYMTVMVLILFGVLSGVSGGRLQGIDAFFTAMSAFANTGLVTVDLNTLPTAAHVTLVVASILGSGVLSSIAPVVLRRYYIRKQLDPAARARLIEYSALGKLQAVVPLFMIGNYLLLFFLMVFWFLARPDAGAPILEANNVTALGFSAFAAVSAFDNLGMAVTRDNMMPFYPYWFPLMVGSFGTLVGVTFYPIALRLVIYLLFRISSGYNRRVYRFLLRHPRRCYTHLFPAAETWWLLFTAITLPVIEFIFFAALEWANGTPFSYMDSAEKFWNAVFMSTTTRVAGFNSVDVGRLNPGMLTLLVGFMYLAALPVVVAVRYSDQSLKPLRQKSVTALVPDMEGQLLATDLRGGNTVRTQTKSFLTQNVVWVFCVYVLICIIEAPQLSNDPNFTSFAVLFEIVSAFGCVGLSMGYPGITSSFSTVWSPGSKFLLMTLMFLGRLRHMPASIDRAVMFLPETVRISRTGVRFRVPGARPGPGDPGARGGAGKRRAPAYTTFVVHSQHQDVLTSPDQLMLITLPAEGTPPLPPAPAGLAGDGSGGGGSGGGGGGGGGGGKADGAAGAGAGPGDPADDSGPATGRPAWLDEGGKRDDLPPPASSVDGADGSGAGGPRRVGSRFGLPRLFSGRLRPSPSSASLQGAASGAAGPRSTEDPWLGTPELPLITLSPATPVIMSPEEAVAPALPPVAAAPAPLTPIEEERAGDDEITSGDDEVASDDDDEAGP